MDKTNTATETEFLWQEFFAAITEYQALHGQRRARRAEKAMLEQRIELLGRSLLLDGYEFMGSRPIF